MENDSSTQNELDDEFAKGFRAGKKDGLELGELIGGGEWEVKLSDVSARLLLISNALRLPVEFQSGRTDCWWKLYVSAAAKEIKEIANGLPGTVNSIYEFEKDVPNDAA